MVTSEIYSKILLVVTSVITEGAQSEIFLRFFFSEVFLEILLEVSFGIPKLGPSRISPEIPSKKTLRPSLWEFKGFLPGFLHDFRESFKNSLIVSW